MACRSSRGWCGRPVGGAGAARVVGSLRENPIAVAVSAAAGGAGDSEVMLRRLLDTPTAYRAAGVGDPACRIPGGGCTLRRTGAASGGLHSDAPATQVYVREPQHTRSLGEASPHRCMSIAPWPPQAWSPTTSCWSSQTTDELLIASRCETVYSRRVIDVDTLRTR